MKLAYFYSSCAKGIILFFTLGTLLWSGCQETSRRARNVLVLYDSRISDKALIDTGIKLLEEIAREEGIQLSVSDDPASISEERLKDFSAVAFYQYKGDRLPERNRADLERFVQAGGGFIGLGAVDFRLPAWRWYGQLTGAYKMTPLEDPQADLSVATPNNPAVEGLPSSWRHKDQYFTYQMLVETPEILLKRNDDDLPVAWRHSFDGGRAAYSGLGQLLESYEDVALREHWKGLLQYAIGGNRIDYSRCRSERVPEENRFIKTVLAQYLDEPMELEMLPDGRILFVERKGRLKMYIPSQERVSTITKLNVHTEHEDGLLGIAIDPGYEQNHWIYLFYSPPGEKPVQHVSRFVFWDDSLHYLSEKVLLKIPVQREECCHSAGALEFGPDGNLYISVGDNTNPFASDGYAPIDERAGRKPWDAQRTSANTNDLRGKILRIRPEADGSYSIPEGNLFPPGQAGTKPEIFVMGCRNPFRISLDSRTGFLYWGDVGPDAGEPGEVRGPKGLDGINQAKTAGFYGWPYSRGNNQAYFDYDFARQRSSGLFDPARPVNHSANNTGLSELPPARSSLIWYSYDRSEEFPWTGTGGKNPMAGPVYYSDQYKSADRFPPYFDGKLLIYEWMRHWVYVVTLDSAGHFVKADPFMPNTTFSRPMDMIFGRDGSLYLLEYGEVWFKQNPDARLSRIDYIKGNRPPLAQIEASRVAGAAPLAVRISGKNSIDYDNDKLSYQWSIDGEMLPDQSAVLNYSFEQPGVYEVGLKVKDPSGASSSDVLQVSVGNEPPRVTVEIDGNKSFYWEGRRIPYQIKIEDQEDGNSFEEGFAGGGADISFDYLPEAYDLTEVVRGHKAGMEASARAPGAALIESLDCKSCHALNKQVNGPSYLSIANRYKGQADIAPVLAGKIIKGGAGNWGQTVMSAHPDLSKGQSLQIVEYILSLGRPLSKEPAMPLEGALNTDIASNKAPGGVFLLMVRYTDQGAEGMAPLSTQKMMAFRPLKLQAERADRLSEGIGTSTVGNVSTLSGMRHSDFFGFEQIDLEGVETLELSLLIEAVEGAVVELHTGSPNGKVIGRKTLASDKPGRMQVHLPVEAEPGKQDLFFVFSLPAHPDRIIAQPDWIYFHHRETNGSINSLLSLE